MLRHFALILALIPVLSACAPLKPTPITGRIVNIQTGQEGSVSFTRGTLSPQLPDPYGPDNVVIALGTQTFYGRTKVLEAASAPAAWGLSLEFGGQSGSASNGTQSSLGWGTRLSTPSSKTGVLYIGNLIARTRDPRPSTLTCNLHIDQSEHGIGECLSNTGVRYTMQF